jgi:excisionase family DNA binding protein
MMKLLSPRQVAERSGLSTDAVYRAIHRGELRASRVCDGSRLRIREDDFERWIAANLVEPKSPPQARGRRTSGRPAKRGSLRALMASEEGAA